MNKRRRKRNVKIVFPSTITTFCMVFGFIGMLLASEGQFYKACVMIMLAMIMDGLDGKVARATNTASEFGIQYDSLSDLIAFGAAPAFIFFRYYLLQHKTDQIYYLLPIMYLVCGAVRLARFNVTASIYGKTHFTGLPIPAAAFMMSAVTIFYEFALNSTWVAEWGLESYFTRTAYLQFVVAVVITLSVAMISSWKFDTPAGFWFHRFKPKWVNFAVFGAFLSINLWATFEIFAMSISFYYILSMIGRAIWTGIKKAAHRHEAQITEEDDQGNTFEGPKVVEVPPPDKREASGS